MAQKFTLLVDSRAGYYCKGSPVHFVRVELFRVEETGDTAVTLTFKNLFTRPLMSLTAYFRCKNRAGEVVVEDSFTYNNVNAAEGECFGCDEAVFVSDEPLASVDVRLASVTYDDGVPHDLRRCTAVSLGRPRPMPPQVRDELNRLLGTDDLAFCPRNAEDGWCCACGAFNYNAGRGAYLCSECGLEKNRLAAALHTAMQPRYSAGMRVPPVEEDVPAYAPRGGAEYAARAGDGALYAEHAAPDGDGPCASIMKDSTADFILRYMPLLTAVAAGVFTMGAVFVAYYLL